MNHMIRSQKSHQLLRQMSSTDDHGDKDPWRVVLQELGLIPKEERRGPVKGPEPRKMLAISRIDPMVLDEIKKRQKDSGLHLYEYCNRLLIYGLMVERMKEKMDGGGRRS